MNAEATDRLKQAWAAVTAACVDAFDKLGILRADNSYKQPSSLYKTPEKPGFIGGYNWGAVTVGFGVLFVSNIVATQFVAWFFSYQAALGAPLLRIGNFGLYQPFQWAAWVLRHGSEANAVTRFGVLIGPLIICIGTVLSFGFVYWQNLRRTRKLSEGTSDLHGSARWATEKDMVDAGVLNQTEGVYIGGWYDPTHQALKYLRHDGPEHVLAFAPTRSGKGVSLVIPTLLGWTESCVVYDIKGENWEKTAGYRNRMGHLCLQFAPCDESGKTTRFNPLNEIRVFSLRDVSDAQNMADILVKSMENRPNDTHWIDTAAQIVTGALLHLCYKARIEGREANLGDLASFFSVFGKGFRDTLTEMSNEEHDPHGTMSWTLPNGRPTRTHPVVLQHVQTMKDKADKEFSSVVSTVNTAFSVYADPLVRRNTAASDFTVNDLVNFEKPVSLYIVVPPSDRLRLTPLVRLTFTLIVNRLTQRMAFAPPPMEEPEGTEAEPGALAAASATFPDAPPAALERVHNKHRLLMMIDEFPTLKKMELFADALSYMGGYGIKAYLIAQDVEQIIEQYGQHESVVSNCHVRIAFAPNKQSTAELLSKMTGTITIEKASFSFSGHRASAVLDHITSSVQQIERPLMTPDEILRIAPAKKVGNGRNERIVAPGEMLIFVSGHPAIHGTQILYFADPAFTQHVTFRPPLHLKAIEDGKEIPQRPLHLARHKTSRPENERPAEREPAATTPAAGTFTQPAPPSATFHAQARAARDPHYQPPVAPPVIVRTIDAEPETESPTEEVEYT